MNILKPQPFFFGPLIKSMTSYFNITKLLSTQSALLFFWTIDWGLREWNHMASSKYEIQLIPDFVAYSCSSMSLAKKGQNFCFQEIQYNLIIESHSYSNLKSPFRKQNFWPVLQSSILGNQSGPKLQFLSYFNKPKYSFFEI